MRKFIILLLALPMVCSFIQAGNSCGIYKSIEDYNMSKISIQADASYQKKAIQVGDFFLHPYVYLKTDSSRLRISMDSVFAIRCSDGKLYRMWRKQAYQLLDSSFLLIYNKTETETVKHHTSKGLRLKMEKVTRFYFSTNLCATILPLTLANICQALLLNERQCQKLKLHFPNDLALQIQVDHTYSINNHLIKQTLK